jgi:UDP-GlcNAc:undecaprenyl-phosphate GlcNAc-1-phosphate transferase
MYVNVVCGLFVGCLLVSAALIPAVMRFARRIDAVDRGGFRKVFQGEMPLLGGLGVAIPLLTLCVFVGGLGHLVIRQWEWIWIHHRAWFDPLMDVASVRNDCLAIAAGGVAIVALGFVDDTRGMRARYKLLGQVAVALFVCFTGHVLTTVSVPFLGTVELGVVMGGLLTMLWVVGLINAFNLIDGIDGLASGIALVGTVALVALSIAQHNAFVTLAGAALAGSLLAFLFYNFPPARIFLGDTGSMFIGYALAVISLLGAQKSEAAVIIFAPMLALSLPLFETGVSMLRRYIGGVPVFTGDNRHTHHRLLRKGYSQPEVVLTLCGTGLVLAVAAVLAALIPETSKWGWCPYALYIGALVNIAWLAGYLRPTTLKAIVERRQRNKIFQSLSRYASLRLNDGMRASQAQVLLELCRHELGLKHLEVRMKSGERLMVSPVDVKYAAEPDSREILKVKSSEGQDILLCYEYKHAPNDNRRQDVSLCLAGIFDGMKAERHHRADNEAHERGYADKVVRFRGGATRGEK